MKQGLENLEIHLTHSCNLSCSNCSHFSNYRHSGLLAVESAREQFEVWAKRLAPAQVSLLGGEPSIHPRLTEFVYLARECFPDCPKILLVSNGWFLANHPQLPAALLASDVELHVSVHHLGPRYQAKVSEVAALIEKWREGYPFSFVWRESYTKWRRIFPTEGKDLRPYNDMNPRLSWEKCPSKRCTQLYEGCLWKCPQAAYLKLMDKKFSLSEQWSPYLAYRPLAPTCSDEELADFFAREEESICSMCPASIDYFHLPSPLGPEDEL